MSYLKIPSTPGVFKDDTPLSAEGYYTDADKIRWVRGKAQIFDGWERASDDIFTGLCRGMHAYLDNSGNAYCALGTHTNFYDFSGADAKIYDCTPIVSRGRLSSPFTTTINLAAVNVAHPSHGRQTGDSVNFYYALGNTATAVGGLTISGKYTVTYVDANNYSITASSLATSSAGPGGGSPDYEYYLATGNADDTGGAGYGTGAYNVGAYGSASTATFYARTWSIGNWGQNWLACPRGGPIYEMSPLFAQTELVTNGNMSSGTGWTQGTGWLIAANVATASAGSASDLSTTVVMNPGAYFNLEFDLTRSAGTLTAMMGNSTLSLYTASSHCQQSFFTGIGPLKFSKSATFAGTVTNVSIKQLINGSILPGAPTQNTCMLVTPERIVMVGGTIDYNTGVFNPMHIRNSDQDTDVTTGLPGSQDWTPTSTNQADFFTLSSGSRIVKMMNGPGLVLCWTDKALYVGRYGVSVDATYTWQLVGDGCGLIGANAATIVAGIAYWMTPAGEFMAYDGSMPVMLHSSIGQDVVNNLAFVQTSKIYAFPGARFGEAGWLYPDERDGQECSRYALMGEKNAWWAPGTFDRTARVDSGVFPFPLATDTSGHLYFHDKGSTADGGPISWSLSTGAFNLGAGDDIFQLNGIIPDFKNQQGNVSIEIGTYLYPGAPRVPLGPYTAAVGTVKVDFIASARQADIVWSGTSAPAGGRFGSPTMDVTDTGMSW